MLSDPTYVFQINQFDRRVTVGGHAERQVFHSAALDWMVGGELRYDRIGKVGTDHADQGDFVENISHNQVSEASGALFSEATWTPLAHLRLMGGLRADQYNFNVKAITINGAAGQKNAAQLSPKAGIAYALNENWELYGNWGRGFHSNDARGVVNAGTPVPGLVAGTGYEGGARFEVGALRLSAAYWWLDVSSELIFVGDSNAVEPKGGSRRRGYELVGFWRPQQWLAFDAVYTGSHARFVRAQDDGGYHIEGSVESAGELGVSAIKGPWEASARLRFLGAYPLLPDNSQRANAETVVNLRGAFRHGHYMIYGEVLNALGVHGKDIVYYYPTHVEGLDPP